MNILEFLQLISLLRLYLLSYFYLRRICLLAFLSFRWRLNLIETYIGALILILSTLTIILFSLVLLIFDILTILTLSLHYLSWGILLLMSSHNLGVTEYHLWFTLLHFTYLVSLSYLDFYLSLSLSFLSLSYSFIYLLSYLCYTVTSFLLSSSFLQLSYYYSFLYCYYFGPSVYFLFSTDLIATYCFIFTSFGMLTITFILLLYPH